MKNNNTSFSYNIDNDPLSIYLKSYYSDISFKPNQSSQSQIQPINTSNPPNSNSNLNPNLNLNPINEITIKEKLQKINSSIYSILLSDKAQDSFQSITGSILSLLSSNTNQSQTPSQSQSQLDLPLINNFFTLLIELICQIKDEIKSKETIIDKLTAMTKLKEDSDRRLFELKKDLKSKQRELDLQFNKSQIEKEKNTTNRKSTTIELNDLRIENKKCLAQINLYKTELRKKDMDYSKIQEKLKSLLTKGLSMSSQLKNSPDIISSINIKEGEGEEVNNAEANRAMLITIERSNMGKIREITNLNSELMSLLKIVHNYLVKIYTNANDKKIYLKGEKKMIMINDDMFTIHLMHPQVMSEFSISFLNNVTYVEKMLNLLIEKVFGFMRYSNMIQKKGKEENRGTVNSNEDSKRNKEQDGYSGDKAKDKDEGCSGLKGNSNKKWFENIVNKKVSYCPNEDNIMRCEDEDEDEEDNGESIIPTKDENNIKEDKKMSDNLNRNNE